MEAEWAPPHHAPPPSGSKDQAGLLFPRRTCRCDAVLAAVVGPGDRVASHALSSMAISKAPRCEIRCLVMHIYSDGIKAYGHERITQPIGRRGKPIKKLRYLPMARAHALARKLQGRSGTTVSVI